MVFYTEYILLFNVDNFINKIIKVIYFVILFFYKVFIATQKKR